MVTSNLLLHNVVPCDDIGNEPPKDSIVRGGNDGNLCEISQPFLRLIHLPISFWSWRDAGYDSGFVIYDDGIIIFTLMGTGSSL